MATRERLEKEVENLQQQIDNAPKDTPQEVLRAWKQELAELSFELNNRVDTDDNNEE